MPGDPRRLKAEVEKARTGNLRLQANVARFEIAGNSGCEFARVGFCFLGQNHGGIGLVVAEPGVGCRGHLAPLGRQSAGDQRRVQPFGQHGLRRGAHLAVTAAAGENLQNVLRSGRGRQFLAHRAVVEEFCDGRKGAQMDLELVTGNDKEHDEVHEFVVQRVKFNTRGRAAEGGHHLGDVLGGGMGMAMPKPMPVLMVSSRCFKASKTLSRYWGSIRCFTTSRSTISVIAGHRSVVFISGIISPTVSKLDSVMRLDPPR